MHNKIDLEPNQKKTQIDKKISHVSYPEIGDSSFRCALWTFKLQLT